jgi:hypothetical protein
MPGVDRWILEATLIFALAGGVFACDPSDGPVAADREPEPASEEESFDQLRALGYVSGSLPAGPLNGVVRHDRKAAQPGLNLFTSGHAPVALLMDMEGNILHEWRADFTKVFPDHPDAARKKKKKQNFWRHAEMLPGGDLLGIWNNYGIFKLDRDSNVIWSLPNSAHHDLDVTDDGRIYTLTSETLLLPEAGPAPINVDFITLLSADGAELRRLSVPKALENARWPKLIKEFWEREKTRKTHLAPKSAKLDPFHTNSVWILSRLEADRLGDGFFEGDILVSMCLLDTIASIDMQEERTTWFQTGPFSLQHHPRVTTDGQIVLFNNHVTRELSSAQIVDPQTGKVTWEYTGPDDAPLHSTTSSSAEMLPGGTILIVETNPGRVLEVTLDKRVVWEYHNPYRVGRDRQKVAHVFHMERVDASLADWLERPAVNP